MKQLVNEGIKNYLGAQSLETSLTALRDYRKRDPGFRRAIATFVEAEASNADPVEGKPVEGQPADGEFKPAGSVQTE